jgi:hypothetical protein
MFGLLLVFGLGAAGAITLSLPLVGQELTAAARHAAMVAMVNSAALSLAALVILGLVQAKLFNIGLMYSLGLLCMLLGFSNLACGAVSPLPMEYYWVYRIILIAVIVASAVYFLMLGLLQHYIRMRSFGDAAFEAAVVVHRTSTATGCSHLKRRLVICSLHGTCENERTVCRRSSRPLSGHANARGSPPKPSGWFAHNILHTNCSDGDRWRGVESADHSVERRYAGR